MCAVWGDIALFKVVSESAVASGVRRIEALTAEAARLYLGEQERIVKEAAGALKISADDLPARILSLVEDRKRLERELNDARKKLAMAGGGSVGDGTSGEEDIPGGKFIFRVLSGISPKDLKGLVDEAKVAAPDSVIAFGTKDEEGKAALVVGVSGAMLSSNNSGELVRIGVVPLGGTGGGGRPDMAQGGGPDGSKLAEAVKAVRAAIKAPA